MRAWWLITFWFLACVAPAPPPIDAPEVPTLELVHARDFFPRAIVRGTAPGALVVRLTVDRDCKGPVLLDVPASAWEQGIEVELAVGLNVFSARSIGSNGKASACSGPVERTRVRGTPPAAPTPFPFSRVSGEARTFVVRGKADAETRVRLHRGNCTQPVEQELNASAFEDAGFTIEFERDGSWVVGLDAVDLIDRPSSCALVTILVDNTAPRVTWRWVSPQPTSQPNAWLEARGDFEWLLIFSGPECDGSQIGEAFHDGSFGRPVLVEVSQPADDWVGPFTAIALDGVGNNTPCLTGPEYAFDAGASSAAELRIENGSVTALVHVRRDRLEVFASSECDGGLLLDLSIPPWTPGQPLAIPQDAGVLTARSSRQGVADPCSAPLTLP